MNFNSYEFLIRFKLSNVLNIFRQIEIINLVLKLFKVLNDKDKIKLMKDTIKK